jgi:competence protein ComEA
MKHLSRIFALVIVVSMVIATVPGVFAQEAEKGVTQKVEQEVEKKVEGINIININKASAEELMQLKGIGDAYAKRIVEYREQQGMFKAPEDIMKVQGIGPKTFESIKDQITVE